MENVRGVLSAAIRHRPLGRRCTGHPRLVPEEELGSAFALILRELRRTGYHVIFDVVNAADFGVPSVRERVLFIGSRDGEPLEMPPPTHAKEPREGQRAWVTLRAAIGGLRETKPAFKTLAASKRRLLPLIPEGGNWKNLPRRLQARALGAAFKSWGGRSGFLRRLSWDRPAPALTTRPDSSATLLCHPTDLRPLSVREYAVIQQFPTRWKLAGGLQQYKQLGNAVPVGLGKAIGFAIRNTMRAGRPYTRRAVVVCHNENLLERIANRPHTVLNPTRMRRVKTLGAARRWLSGRKRAYIMKLVARRDNATRSERRSTTG